MLRLNAHTCFGFCIKRQGDLSLCLLPFRRSSASNHRVAPRCHRYIASHRGRRTVHRIIILCEFLDYEIKARDCKLKPCVEDKTTRIPLPHRHVVKKKLSSRRACRVFCGIVIDIEQVCMSGVKISRPIHDDSNRRIPKMVENLT